jgi:hypothetical protein
VFDLSVNTLNREISRNGSIACRCKDLQTQYEKALDSASISRELRPQFRKWLRFYLDFCSKYGHSPGLKSSLPHFMGKLASKNQPEAKRGEASVAVTLYLKMADTGKANALSKSKTESDRACSKGAEPAGASPVTAIRAAQGDHPARKDRPLTNSPGGVYSGFKDSRTR